LLYIVFIYLFIIFIIFSSPVLEIAAAVVLGYKHIIYFSNLNEYVIVEFVFLFRNYGFIWYL